MRRRDSAGGRWRVVGRTAAVAFAVLSVVVVLVGCVFVQFDDQYDASSGPERLAAGILGGLLAAAILTPVTALISLAVGGVISLVEQRRSPSPPRP